MIRWFMQALKKGSMLHRQQKKVLNITRSNSFAKPLYLSKMFRRYSSSSKVYIPWMAMKRRLLKLQIYAKNSDLHLSSMKHMQQDYSANMEEDLSTRKKFASEFCSASMFAE